MTDPSDRRPTHGTPMDPAPPSVDHPTDSLVEEFHQVAHRLLNRDSARADMVTGDLVNTSLERLYRLGKNEGLSRPETVGRLARVMRRVLVDKARYRNRGKRAEGRRPEQLDPNHESTRGLGSLGTLEVHEALETLKGLDPRQARVVELRYFCGFTDAEIADALDCSVRTVFNDWRHARAWLLERFRAEKHA